MRVRKAVFPPLSSERGSSPRPKAQPKEMLPLVDKPMMQPREISLAARIASEQKPEPFSDVTALFCSHTAQARQMLWKLLTGKIGLEAVGRGRERGYRFRGALCIERLIGGEALQTTLSMVARSPKGGPLARTGSSRSTASSGWRLRWGCEFYPPSAISGS
jgi:hypothetical protein